MLWSTDKGIVGRRFRDNVELNAAAAGTPRFALGVVGRDEKTEHADLPELGRPFVENYIPMFRGGQIGSEVLGVMEVYRSPQALFDTIRAGRWLIFGSAIVGAVLIVGALWWLVRRAERMLHRQEAEIAAAERLATAGEMASAVAHGLRNPEGRAIQGARLEDGRTVASALADDITAFNVSVGGAVGPVGANIEGPAIETVPAEHALADVAYVADASGSCSGRRPRAPA